MSTYLIKTQFKNTGDKVFFLSQISDPLYYLEGRPKLSDSDFYYTQGFGGIVFETLERAQEVVKAIKAKHPDTEYLEIVEV